jgi:exonuclease III
VSMASNPECIVFNWNVRGAVPSKAACAHRQLVRDLIADHHDTIICLQETKLPTVDDSVIITTLGQQFTANYATLPTDGTRGGIIIACSQDYFAMSQVLILQHSIMATITSTRSNVAWMVTGVYDPHDDNSKMLFLQELRQMKQRASSSWILLEDFNLIYRQEQTEG